jgi:hypothetical protein
VKLENSSWDHYRKWWPSSGKTKYLRTCRDCGNNYAAESKLMVSVINMYYQFFVMLFIHPVVLQPEFEPWPPITVT